MIDSAPLLLVFDSGIEAVESGLRLLLENSAYFIADSDNMSSRGGIPVVFEGISLFLTVSGYRQEGASCRRIFTNFGFTQAQSIVALSLGEHVAGGQRVPPVARALLVAGAQIAQSLQAKAVLWSPADLLSDVNYFAEVVGSYGSGGAFPVLPTVNFAFDERHHLLSTSGLKWFCGQELHIEDDQKQTDQLVLMKKAVRLVHDMAVNGPILTEQTVADIYKNNWITLSPNASADIVTAKISSSLDGISLVPN